MKYFQLPPSTIIDKVIPKNSFDKYTSAKQKKMFKAVVERIRWTNKLAVETVNLNGNSITEIQVFEIELREKVGVIELLNIIDRSIPYHIVFVIFFEDFVMLSATSKHTHPINENQSVVDWSFTSDWFSSFNRDIQFNLEQNLDFVFVDICKQISGQPESKLPLNELIINEELLKKTNKAISSLEVAIKNCKQFNKTVELNIELNKVKNSLSSILKKKS